MWSKGLALCLVCIIAFPLLSSCNQEKKDQTKIAESSTLEEKDPDVCESDSCENTDVMVDSLRMNLNLAFTASFWMKCMR